MAPRSLLFALLPLASSLRVGAPVVPRHAVRATGQSPATLPRSQLPMMVKAQDEEKKGGTMEQIKEAGVAGIISYIFWEWAFWGVSVPVCIFGYREVLICPLWGSSLPVCLCVHIQPLRSGDRPLARLQRPG